MRKEILGKTPSPSVAIRRQGALPRNPSYIRKALVIVSGVVYNEKSAKRYIALTELYLGGNRV